MESDPLPMDLRFRGGARFARAAGALALLLALQGCGLIYKTTGGILVGFGRSGMTPHLLQTRDLPMACATGSALGPFLESFERVNVDPDRLVVLTRGLAALCAQQKVNEHALRYARAINRGDAAAAQDARSRQKRQAGLAAARLYASHRRMTGSYPEVTAERCPRLRTDFDELVFLVGWLNGVQALLHDATAGGSQAVPRNIAARARRAAQCLDNDKWWGVPHALRASVAVILPALAPDDATPWPVLEHSVERGYASGVRLSSALYVLAADSVGDRERIRAGIRGYAAHGEQLDPDHALIDAIAGFLVRGVSDRIWTRETGRRTPMGALGRFPGEDREDDSGISVEELL